VLLGPKESFGLLTHLATIGVAVQYTLLPSSISNRLSTLINLNECCLPQMINFSQSNTTYSPQKK